MNKVIFWFLNKDEDNIPVPLIKGIQFDTITQKFIRIPNDKIGNEWDMDIDLELCNQLKYYNIDYKVNLIERECSISLDTNLIWISIPGFFELKTTLNKIPKKVLEFAKINNATILINNARESFDDYPPGKFPEKVISNFIKRKKFPNHLIKVIINNHGLPNNITKPEYFRPINHWPMFMVQYTIPNIIKHNIKKKKYNFCFLAGHMRKGSTREEFLAKGLESGIIDDNFFYTKICYNPKEVRDRLKKCGYNKNTIKNLTTTYVVDLFGNEMLGSELYKDVLPGIPASTPDLNLPPQSLSSYVNIAIESRLNCKSVTEKVYKHIHRKLPFLALGYQNLHTKVLHEMGFKLYDEVFDYSFDCKEAHQDRIDLLLKELQRLSNTDLSEIQDILKPKLEYNYNNFMKIANDKSTWIYSLTGNYI